MMSEVSIATETTGISASRLKRWEYAWLALALLSFLLPALDKLQETGALLAPLDTASYLSDARQIHERGGIPAMLADCYQGRYKNANQMPLYIALLSFLPSETLQMLAWAKMVTVAIGAAGILTAFFIARRLLGTSAAMLVSAALACNTAWLLHSSLVACEALLGIWVMLGWYFIIRYLRGARSGAWIGLSIGLAYMTKASGIFLAPVAVGAMLYKERLRALHSRQLWTGIIVFLLVASPILVRNVRRYGSPFYNINTFVMWQNRWDDYYSPDPALCKPTLRSYLQTHSSKEIFRRIARGGVQEGVYFVVMAGQTYLLNERLHIKAWPIGLMTLLLVAAACVPRQTRPTALTTVSLAAIFFMFFSWYPVKDMRFIVPLLPVLLTAATGAILWSLKRLDFGRLPRRIRTAALPGILAVVLATATIGIAVGRPNVWKDPTHCTQTPPGYYELLTWMENHIGENDVYMMGPTHAYSYFWTSRLGATRIDIPIVSSIAETNIFARTRNIRFVIVDYGTFEQRRKLLGDYIRLADDYLQLASSPEGWRRVFPMNGDLSPFWVFDVGNGRQTD